MLQDFKTLVVVLGLSLPIWVLARRLMAPFMSDPDYVVRRNAWLAITAAALVSPNIWMYSLVAVPVMIWAGRRDSNPGALYLLLMCAVPPASVPIPGVLVNQLFDISHVRLLAFALLIPAAWRIGEQRSGVAAVSLDAMDRLLLIFVGLILLLFIPYESGTNSLRRIVLYGLDTLLLYYVFSRVSVTSAAIGECLAAWMLAGLLMAAVALFETSRSWLLFVGISDRWGDPNEFAFLLRGSSLRAQATTGHSLALGYWLAISWCFFLCLQHRCPVKWLRIAAGVLLLGGLWASLSRGPWLTAFLVTILVLLLNPRGPSTAIKRLGVMALLTTLALMSPLGERIVDFLPFVGTVDSGNVDYRQRLFETAWPLILDHPFGGNPLVMTQLESLRQGQGIIDLMNGYLQIALFYGLLGLALFGALLLLATCRTWVVWRRLRSSDPDAAYSGAALVAAMLGSMFFIATASYGATTFVLAGLCASCWRTLRDTRPATFGSRASRPLGPMPTR